jgi:hypothetical protein
VADAACGVQEFIDGLDAGQRDEIEAQKTADAYRTLVALGFPMRPNVLYKHRAGSCSCALPPVQRKTDPPPHTEAEPTGWRIEVTSDAADVQTAALDRPLVAADDWDGVLLHFGLNPGEFQIVDDTVKMSSWQQSRRTDDGDRDVVTLYSYRARFARITNRLPDADIDAVAKRVQAWKLPRRTPGSGLGAPCTFYEGWADWQLGKSAGGGADGTAQRALDAIEQTVRRIKDLRRIGRNVTSVAVWNMGDPTEGCDGNYASQLYTVEMTRRQQLNLALDLWLAGIKTLAPLVDDLEFGSVLCNHGEWTRQGPGTKPVTSDSDNIGGYLGDVVSTVLADRPGFDHVRFTIPHDEMTMSTTMSGVPVALAHGHKAPTGSKAELEWLRGQSLRLLRERGVEPRLWMTAHRHHYEIKDYGPWTRIQHPSLDFGSKWYEDTSGMWSTPGTFTCLVGEHDQAGGTLDRSTATGFSDEMVLPV